MFIAEDFDGGRDFLRLVAGFYGDADNFGRFVKRDPVEVVRDEGTAVEGRAGGEDDFVFLHVLPADVHRRRKGKAEALSLADGVADDTLMLAENMALGVDELSGCEAFSGIMLDEVAVVTVHDEADVLGVVLTGVDEAVLLGYLSNLFLRGEVPERKHGVRELLLGQEVEHIALILCEVFRLLEEPASGRRVLLDAGVVAGDDDVAAKGLGAVIELLVLHIAVTIDARIRGAALLVGPHEAFDDLTVEVFGKVKDIVRHAEARRDLAGILGILEGTAGIFATDIDGFIIIQLHGDTDGVVAGIAHQRGRHRAVDTAAHRHQGLFLCFTHIFTS